MSQHSNPILSCSSSSILIATCSGGLILFSVIFFRVHCILPIEPLLFLFFSLSRWTYIANSITWNFNWGKKFHPELRARELAYTRREAKKKLTKVSPSQRAHRVLNLKRRKKNVVELERQEPASERESWGEKKYLDDVNFCERCVFGSLEMKW